MKRRNYKKLVLTILSSLIFALVPTVLVFAAAQTYTPLEPNAFPGITVTSQTTLTQFLGYVFDFGIAIAVVLALVMIIWGGIEYMTTDSWMGKSDGTTKIKDALYGLGLAIVSYLILYTINPCLVVFTTTSTCNNTFLNPTNTTTVQTPANGK